MTEQPKKRGGPQPGSGPKPKNPADKVVKCYISMTQAHHAATEGDRSGMIRRALDVYLGMRGTVDGCRDCINNKPGREAGLWCINNCINGSMYNKPSK